jgi:isopenicillin N synthase-like dioxygenase
MTEPVIRRRNTPRRRRRDGLIRFASDNTSQNGEDGVIQRIFDLVKSERNPRFCVDVGAWDGIHLSNSHSLLVHRQWQGVLIEANQERFQELTSLHEPLGNVCLCAAVSCQEKSPQSLVSLLQTKAPHLPKDFEFISIDVDGADYWLLHDLWKPRGYRPMVVCIEFNPTMPDDLVYIPERSDLVRHGASLSALYELAEEQGYVLVETTLYNAFFVRRDLYQQYLVKEVPETTIEALHETTMGTSLYQLYDGTLKLWGCKKLLWHRLPIDEKLIQMLPPDKRDFPFAPQGHTDHSPLNEDLLNAAVDMAPYCKASAAESNERKTCADALLKQLQADGFALVRGTGISKQTCVAALHSTNSFLHEADESVRRHCLTKDRARRGYSPMCTENFASLVGDKAPNDLVRKFRMGPVAVESIADSPLLRPNVWPEEATEFRSSLESYYETTSQAAHAIVRAICDGIVDQQPKLEASLEVLSMKDSVTHSSILALLGYRPGTRHKRKEKPPLVAAHTDVGVITFLLFDDGDCATLQRADRRNDGSWVDVKLPRHVGDDPVFVVNIGDCLSELCKGMLPSTLHRVVPQSASVPRNCLALFVGLDPQETLTLPDRTTMTFEEWRKHRIARAQSVLKSGGL